MRSLGACRAHALYDAPLTGDAQETELDDPETSPKTSPRVTYPETRRDDVVETLHGVEVTDPYRWLEDLDSEETADWVRRQNVITDTFLGSIPERTAIRARLERLWDHEKFGVPYRKAGRVFYRRNSGLQSQAVLHVAESLEAEPRVLLDPNTLSTDGTIALGPTAVSPDGKLLAYGLQESGSDWIEWRVRDIDTGEDREDRIRWSKFSEATWSKDALGFYYSAYDAPEDGKTFEGANFHQRLWYHRVGTPQCDDELIFAEPQHPKRGFQATVSDDGRLFVISVWEGTARENRLYVRDLHCRGKSGDEKSGDGENGAGEVVRLLDDADASYTFVGSLGTTLFVCTDRDADRSRVVAIDLNASAAEEPDADQPCSGWREVVPEMAENLVGASLVGGQLICAYLKDAHSLVRVFAADGAFVRDVALPGIGSALGFHGDASEPETFFVFSGFMTPAAVYRYDVATGAASLYRRPDVPFDPSDFETQQVFCTSRDGTRIPLFVTHRKGLVLDGQNPTLLYGYGGFNIPLTPAFSPSNLAWMEMGGVHVVANLRGGGEYGEEWHTGGMKAQKQNVFDDFIAAAEWLIDAGFTTSPRLAIHGGSNGGLLIGACMTQRPELFGAALPAVGVLDMLRFHRFTIGWAWISDYGSPDDADMFPHLLAYSPLHNLRSDLPDGSAYPPTMVMTGDHDDRVVPSHSFKFAAQLQHVQPSGNPCLIRIETRAGHGAGKPTAKVLDEHADKWTFLIRALDMQLPAAFGA